jgi:hypothetical protein
MPLLAVIFCGVAAAGPADSSVFWHDAAGRAARTTARTLIAAGILALSAVGLLALSAVGLRTHRAAARPPA